MKKVLAFLLVAVMLVAVTSPAFVTLNVEPVPSDIPSVPIYTPAVFAVKVDLPLYSFVLPIVNPLELLPI